MKWTNGCQVTIAENVVKVNGRFLREGCHVCVSPLNRHFVCDDLFLYSIDKRKIYRCFGEKSSVVIPRCVERLGKFCFSDCKSISSIEFESGSDLK